MSFSAWRFWAWPRELRRMGVLGINRRNADYVLALNPRRNFPNVDDKLRSKQICEACGIAVPATYAVLSRHGDIRQLPGLISDRCEFVVKPAHGSGGRGILIVAHHDEQQFILPNGSCITLNDFRYHVASILSGLFSLGELPDTALIEQRIVCHSAFKRFAVDGTPDVRVIVYRGLPVMAMVRLPTLESQGRANLHQGAVAAAVDLSSGRTFGGVCKNRIISRHPDTAAPIQGFNVPGWRTLIASAITLSDNLGLGYVGIDFVVDQQRGPLVLEANARPGLAIQVANRTGLLKRLEFVDQRMQSGLTVGERFELMDEMQANFEFRTKLRVAN